MSPIHNQIGSVPARFVDTPVIVNLLNQNTEWGLSVIYSWPTGRSAIEFRGKKNRPGVRIQENLIFIELIRRKYAVSYYRTEDGYEIDFVVQDKKRRQRPHIIQVSYELSSEDVIERELRAIEKSYQFLNAESATIITLDEERKLTRNGLEISVIPAWKWLLGNGGD